MAKKNRTFPRFLTARKLRSLGACRSEVAEFQREWPEGAEFTLENLLRAAELSLDIEWLAEVVLKGIPEGTFNMTATALYSKLFDDQKALGKALLFPGDYETQRNALDLEYDKDVARCFYEMLSAQLEAPKA